MAKRLFPFMLNTNTRILSSIQNWNNGVISKNIHTNEIPVKEIQIPTRWGGHISAKLWGNDNEQPILALHGWQDNAGTWDPLAPMLCSKRPILAIDFPGHGFSSWIPRGMQYYPWDLPRLIFYIQNYFKWDKISFLCHSMGSIAAMRFASIFPDAVKFYIAIDSLIYDDYDLNLMVGNFPKIIRKIEIAQTRIDTPAPCYTVEELVDRWHRGTNGSVSKESVPYLLKRGTKESTTEPNKYYISRDPRLKNALFCPEDKPLIKALVSRLKCPTLYIKGKDSPYACDDYSVEMREIIAQNNSDFIFHILPGTHHLHLNNADRIAPPVLEFLEKYNL